MDLSFVRLQRRSSLQRQQAFQNVFTGAILDSPKVCCKDRARIFFTYFYCEKDGRWRNAVKSLAIDASAHVRKIRWEKRRIEVTL